MKVLISLIIVNCLLLTSCTTMGAISSCRSLCKDGNTKSYKDDNVDCVCQDKE